MTTEPDPAADGSSGSGSGAPADATPPPAVPPPGKVPINRAGMIVGAVLILLGLVFLAQRFFEFDLGQYGWPLFIVVPGVLLFLAGLAAPRREGSGLAVGGAVVSVVGVILAVQNVTGLWATWAYVWPLVAPGGSGLGLALYGLLRDEPDLVRSGVRSLGIGLALFVAFGVFFEGVIGLSGDPFLVGSDYLPFALIGLGVVLLGWALLRGRRTA
ncbi:MAG: hypothetical protein ACJ76W_02455 [Chloroflexota bacterium]